MRIFSFTVYLILVCSLLTTQSEAMFASFVQKLSAPVIGALFARRYSQTTVVHAKDDKNLNTISQSPSVDSVNEQAEDLFNGISSNEAYVSLIAREKRKLAETILAHKKLTDPTNQREKDALIAANVINQLFEGTKRREFIDQLIIDKKIELARSILIATGKLPKPSAQVDKDKDPEARLFEPKKPTPLSPAERAVNVQERIAKKYIGTIPSQVSDVIFYYGNHPKCVEEKVSIYNRLLLHGKPGTGKSHLAKVLGQELEVDMMYFSASFFADKYIGETSRRVRKAFDGARAHNKPVFVFIDELDALATKRKDSTHEEHRATLITLLTELQELQDNKNIFVFAATNDLEALDPAIKDRFAGSVCEIKQLTTEQKALLYKKMFADKNMKIDDIELVNRLAAVTNDTFSNRDIDYIVTTALLKKFADCQQNKRCDEHITKYVRLAMDSTGKTGSFYSRLNTKYGNGF